ncbi:regulatory protein [Tenacibaculum holothuriorum]|uniref:Regulatory protein n=1 Tax=Tenacibaculum holothuriorum TaxID=1635173 RepID=A0A1Y2PFX3_9FLAO|nr:response regulator transcription factor [Tenacibaculum holothuriorum]OSY88707.1 regulatory protein [Tenacibaculum holothuriorum]
MKKTVLVFGLLILALLLFFQVSKYAIISGDFKVELIIALVAIFSFVIGVFFNKKTKKKVPSKEINHKKIKELEITSREYEVLQLIAKGLSNKEIAAELFLSESTIKTHVSNLLVKLNAKRRTQAVQVAKEILIIV